MVSSSPTTFLLPAGYTAAIGRKTSMGAYALVRRDNRVARAFGAVMVALVAWAFGAFGRLLVTARPGWRALTTVMCLGVAATPVLFVVFAAYYTSRGSLLSRRRIAALFVVPSVTVLAVATNHHHALFFQTVEPRPFAGGTVLYGTGGPLFGLHAAYSYLLLAGGALLVVRFAVENRRVYRRWSVAILVGALVPWVTNAVCVFGYGASVPADPTPVGFAVGGVALAYAVFDTGVTNLTPVARSAVVDAIDDAVFVAGRVDELVG